MVVAKSINEAQLLGCTVRKVLADFAVCDWWRYCRALRLIEENGRKFRHIQLKYTWWGWGRRCGRGRRCHAPPRSPPSPAPTWRCTCSPPGSPPDPRWTTAWRNRRRDSRIHPEIWIMYYAILEKWLITPLQSSAVYTVHQYVTENRKVRHIEQSSKQ